jgi:hypothetical protein
MHQNYKVPRLISGNGLLMCLVQEVTLTRVYVYIYIYIYIYICSGTSVHEFNSFLEAVRHPKCS